MNYQFRSTLVFLTLLLSINAYAHDDGTVHVESSDDSSSKEVKLVPIRMNVKVDDANTNRNYESKTSTRAEDKVEDERHKSGSHITSTTSTEVSIASTGSATNTVTESEELEPNHFESRVKRTYKRIAERVESMFKNFISRINN